MKYFDKLGKLQFVVKILERNSKYRFNEFGSIMKKRIKRVV